MEQLIIFSPLDDCSDISRGLPKVDASVAVPPTDATVAIIGWVDETASTKTKVVLGCVSFSSAPSASMEELTRAINLLVKQHPCQHSVAVGDAHGCSECSACTIYQSLRILGTARAGASDNPQQSSANAGVRHQSLIMYNPKEAALWHQRYFDPHLRHLFPNASWQRNSLRMGKALKVLEEISTAMQEEDTGHTEKMASTTNDEKHERIAGGSCPDPGLLKRSNATHSYFDAVSSQSLFLLHFRCRRSFGKGGVNKILSRIPLLSILQQALMRNNVMRSNHIADSTLVAIGLDCLLGVAMGCILLAHPIFITKCMSELWANFHDDKFNKGLKWLESFPAGFKLNVPLTQQMNQEVRLVLQYHRKIVSYMSGGDSCVVTAESIALAIPTTIIGCLGLFTMIFGAQFFFALAFDFSRLVLLHIKYLSSLFAAWQRIELSTLGSLWRLFRGMKRNVLRKRSDHLKYDHMQLLLGMILFTICLFHFTTILVYHAFFAVVSYLADLCVCGIWWSGFMAIEAVKQYDLVVMEKWRSESGSEKSWIGKGMQFVPVRLKPSEMARAARYLGTIGIDIDHSAKPIQAEECSQERRKQLYPHVTISSEASSVLKAVFPSPSGPRIVASGFVSFVLSKASRVVKLIQRLVLGTPCPVGAAFVEMCTSTRDRLLRNEARRGDIASSKRHSIHPV